MIREFFRPPGAVGFHPGLDPINPYTIIGRADFSGHGYPWTNWMKRVKRIPS